MAKVPVWVDTMTCVDKALGLIKKKLEVGPIYGSYRTVRWVQVANNYYNPPPAFFRTTYSRIHCDNIKLFIVHSAHLKLEPALSASYRARDGSILDLNTLPPHDSDHKRQSTLCAHHSTLLFSSGLRKQRNPKKSACLVATILRSHTPSTARYHSNTGFSVWNQTSEFMHQTVYTVTYQLLFRGVSVSTDTTLREVRVNVHSSQHIKWL
jgi:hypothetical protein